MSKSRLALFLIGATTVAISLGLALANRRQFQEPDWVFKVTGYSPVIAASRDGRYLAVGTNIAGVAQPSAGPRQPGISGRIEVWDIANRKFVRAANTIEGVKSLRFTPYGARLFGWTSDIELAGIDGRRSLGSLVIWDFQSNVAPIQIAMGKAVQSASISFDGTTVCALLHSGLGEEPELHLARFDAHNVSIVDKVDFDGVQLPNGILGRRSCVEFSPSGLLLISSHSADRRSNQIEVWNLATKQLVRQIDTGIGVAQSISFIPGTESFFYYDGTHLCRGQSDSSLTSKSTIDVEWPVRSTNPPIDVNSDASVVAVGGAWKSNGIDEKGGVVLCQLPDWKFLRLVKLRNWHTGICDLCFAKNGELIVTASVNGDIRAWSIRELMRR